MGAKDSFRLQLSRCADVHSRALVKREKRCQVQGSRWCLEELPSSRLLLVATSIPRGRPLSLCPGPLGVARSVTGRRLRATRATPRTATPRTKCDLHLMIVSHNFSI